jgi:hypothetical protein
MNYFKRLLKRLTCPHLNWTDNKLNKPEWHPYTRHGDRVGYTDWRTRENYWACTRCWKVKDFGYGPTGPNVPIQFT